MKSILRTLAFTGILGAAAAAAQAQVGIAVNLGPPAPPVVYAGYQPPCPGPDFYWTAGYYAGGVWCPGRWMHRDYYYGHRDFHNYGYARAYNFDHRGWDHGRR
jgi:hypothetical protein